MRAVRALLGGLGVVLVLVGCWRLLRIGESHPAKLVDVGVWLGGGVVLHDAVVAPVVVVASVLLAPRLPRSSRAPAAAGLVVLLTLTLLAVPLLGRFGARPDNPSLLDRPYVALWLLVLGLVLAAVVAASLVRARRAAHPPPGRG